MSVITEFHQWLVEEGKVISNYHLCKRCRLHLHFAIKGSIKVVNGSEQVASYIKIG